MLCPSRYSGELISFKAEWRRRMLLAAGVTMPDYWDPKQMQKDICAMIVRAGGLSKAQQWQERASRGQPPVMQLNKARRLVKKVQDEMQSPAGLPAEKHLAKLARSCTVYEHAQALVSHTDTLPVLMKLLSLAEQPADAAGQPATASDARADRDARRCVGLAVAGLRELTVHQLAKPALLAAGCVEGFCQVVTSSSPLATLGVKSQCLEGLSQLLQAPEARQRFWAGGLEDGVLKLMVSCLRAEVIPLPAFWSLWTPAGPFMYAEFKHNLGQSAAMLFATICCRNDTAIKLRDLGAEAKLRGLRARGGTTMQPPVQVALANYASCLAAVEHGANLVLPVHAPVGMIDPAGQTPQHPVQACAACGKQEDEPGVQLKHCGRCKGPRYCGVPCQKVHWKRGHKAFCQEQRAFDS
ncbi:hypothetical protein WJX72_008323 [[Myrmecia] bisecta]|uniref:MYND-type domain-containing protein n=1 Tax=[Myrmecia] bisecta TaxID=41462 RepID=A0AAW1QFS3_9CHLO